jgi:hypothetical protein
MAELEGIRGECQLATGGPGTLEAFTRMHEAAERTGCASLLAGAKFRLAAAGDARAPELAAEAARIVAACLEGLPDEARGAYLGVYARKRILEGRYLGFGQARALPRGSAPLLHRPGFGPGLPL